MILVEWLNHTIIQLTGGLKMNLHNISFSGKSGIITGAAQGIGKAIAKQFVQMGGKAVIVDINPESAA